MKVLSLFSGVGGFDMGLERAGMETVFQCEWDKHANTILNKHWPHVPKWDDVSTLTGKHILAGVPVIDVVAWGSPCQDLSVAGKRGGLEGERSGLFHEGIRIIKELRKETNGQYPRISIWENVVGALNSNRGADFGIILDEMAQAGAMVIEWAVLDAQYFGVPQRRRRVFVIAIFDPVLAERCPETLLPVAESLPGHLAKGKPARKSVASKTAKSVGADGQWAAGTSPNGDFLTTSVTSKWHKGSGGPSGSEYYNMVVENQDVVGSLAARDYKGVGNQYVNENKCVVEPFVKSSRAQTAEDSETWVEGKINPTLNSFDQGDVRATTAIVEPIQMKNNPVKEIVGSLQARVTATNHESIRDGHAIVEELMLIDGTRVDDVRIYEPPVQTLKERMGTGGNNVPIIGFSHTQGLDAQPSEKAWPTLRKEESGHAVAIPTEPTVFQPGTMIRLNGGIWEGTVPTLRAEAKRGDNEPHIQIHNAEPSMAVRRLTPLECERLMGWPDDHTRYKADGTEQADTHRYKQCGNGVASPVAQWIAKHLLKLEEQQ